MPIPRRTGGFLNLLTATAISACQSFFRCCEFYHMLQTFACARLLAREKTRAGTPVPMCRECKRKNRDPSPSSSVLVGSRRGLGAAGAALETRIRRRADSAETVAGRSGQRVKKHAEGGVAPLEDRETPGWHVGQPEREGVLGARARFRNRTGSPPQPHHIAALSVPRLPSHDPRVVQSTQDETVEKDAVPNVGWKVLGNLRARANGGIFCIVRRRCSAKRCFGQKRF